MRSNSILVQLPLGERSLAMRGAKGVVALLAGGLVHAAVIAVVALTAPVARADIMSSADSTLNEDFSGSLGNSPFGTVVINLLQNGTHATATVTFTAAPGYAFKGGPDAVDLNLLNTNFTFNTQCGGCTVSGLTDTGPGTLPNYGPFNLTVTYATAAAEVSMIEFQLVDTTGHFCVLPNCNAADLGVANIDGFDAAADIVNTTTGASGLVGEIDFTPVPEPGSLALFGTALAGLCLFCGGYMPGPRLRARV
jgi:hypothetical protein